MPSGKGKKLIIVHFGSEDGFLKKGLLPFQSNKTGDYYEDLNSDVFEDYLRVEKTQTSSWRKQEIIYWLTSKDIPLQVNIIKKKLESTVNLHKHRFMKYAVEDISEKYHIMVLRLPPYHCGLNPIVWARLKGFAAR